ncbi:MAG: ABC transporter substrate-binding protein [Methanothrix sp.]
MKKLAYSKMLGYLMMACLCLLMAVMPTLAADNAKDQILNKTVDSITLIDSVGRTVTVPMPVERIIPTDYRTTEALLALGARDMIVGVDTAFHQRMTEFGLKDVPEASVHAGEVNYEEILLLRPNLIILPVSGASYADEVAKKLPGIPVIVMSATTRQDGIPELKILGQILEKEEQANKLISWTEKYAGIVEERTKNLKAEEMPTFYYEYMSESSKWQAIPPSNPAGMVVEGCGGKNLAADLKLNGSVAQLEAEWVLSKNPDFIFMDLMKGLDSGPGKTEDDMKSLLAKYIDARAAEGFKNLTAVQNNHVYLIDRDMITGPRWVIGHVCFAKWLHPDLFNDLSPEDMNNEYLKEFHGIDVQGTWAYPLPK